MTILDDGTWVITSRLPVLGPECNAFLAAVAEAGWPARFHSLVALGEVASVRVSWPDGIPAAVARRAAVLARLPVARHLPVDEPWTRASLRQVGAEAMIAHRSNDPGAP